MTGTARRRPITSHPAFAPLIALWFAALLGLTVAVLPAEALAGWLRGADADGPATLTPAARIAASGAAAALGLAIGYALARRIARHRGEDPRPIYADANTEFDRPVDDAPVRRPLRVHEELAGGLGDESQVVANPEPETPDAYVPPVTAEPRPQDGFMILTPQPIHPPQPGPDLQALLDQFDTAFAAFRVAGGAGASTGNEREGADPVQAFVARQTGVPAPSASPIGGLVPDHQAELRAALDKLARSQRSQ